MQISKYSAALVCYALFVFFCAVQTVHAATLTVTKTADTNDGVCDADCSLREAVAVAAPNDTIQFSSLFNSPQTITLGGTEIYINKSLTINGTGATLLSISGNNASRVLFFDSAADITLNGVTIANGQILGNGQGAGVHNRGTLRVNNCQIVGNAVRRTFPPSTSQALGGGVFNTGNLTFTNSTINANSSDSFQLDNHGGGIYNNGNLNLINSTVTGNVAESGGTDLGGGIYNRGVTKLINSTVYLNRGEGTGSAIYNFRSPFITGFVFLINSVVANGAFNSPGSTLGGGSGGAGTGVFDSFGNNLIDDAANSSGLIGSDIINPVIGLDPTPLLNGGTTTNHNINLTSSGLNGGNNCVLNQTCPAQVNPPAALATDQRGSLRRFGANVDIGSVEKEFIVTNNADSGAGSLRFVIGFLGAGDTVQFDAGFFATPRTINLTGGEIIINKNLNINPPDGLTIDAGLANRIFQVDSGVTFNLSNITLTRGNAGAGSGGAILNFGTTNLSNSTISNSTSAIGGAIGNGGTFNITDSTISGNSAPTGGAISNGGAGGTMTITNSTVSGNAATADSGGGIRNLVGTVNLDGVTVAFNTAATYGGGIINDPQIGNFVRPRNTIISNNTAPIGGDITNAIDSQGYNIVRILNIGDGGGFGANDMVGTGGNPVSVNLAPLGNYGGKTRTHKLLTGSAAINSADPMNVSATDQRGVSRPSGGRADIGSYELSTIVFNANAGGADSLRQALANSFDGDTIIFDPTFFNVPRTINLSGSEIGITKAVTIQGTGANLLTISGNNQSRVFSIAPSLSGVTITDLTITQGGNVPNGGGIFASSPLNLDNVVLTGNSANVTGGAIYNNYSLVNLNNTTVSNNISLNGSGGGIYSENFGSGTPGTSTVNIRNSTFSGNEARGIGSGGGIMNNLGRTRISNSTFSANSSVNGGSAVYHAGGQPLRIANSTFTLNTDTNTGLAVYAESNSFLNVINNSIVAGNIGRDIFGMEGANNLIGNGDFSNFINGVNGNIVGTTINPVNPMLDALSNNGGQTQTHALQPNSPAKNAGNNSLAVDTETGQPLTTDQRGQPRIVESLIVPNVDIGAFEIQAPLAALASISGKVSTADGRGIRNARVILTDSNGTSKIVTTSTFGYFGFDDLTVGETYILQVSSKRFIFQNQTQIINLTEDLTDIIFVAEPF